MSDERNAALEQERAQGIRAILEIFQETLHFLNEMRSYLQYHFKEPLGVELTGGSPPTMFMIVRWNSDKKKADRRHERSQRYLMDYLDGKRKSKRKTPEPDIEESLDMDFTFGNAEEVVTIQPLDFLFQGGSSIEILIHDKRRDVRRVVERFGKGLARYFGAKVEFRTVESLREILGRADPEED